MSKRRRGQDLPSRVLRGIVLPALGFASAAISTRTASADPVDSGARHASSAPPTGNTQLPPPGTSAYVPPPGRSAPVPPPGSRAQTPNPPAPQNRSGSSAPPSGTGPRVRPTPGPPPHRVDHGRGTAPPGPPVRHNRPGPPVHSDPMVGLDGMKPTADPNARSVDEIAETRRSARATGGDGEPGCAGAVAIRRRGPA